MKFLVTGATGFIGKRVVKQLLNKNISVIASDVRIDEEQKYFFEYLNQNKLNINNLKLIE